MTDGGLLNPAAGLVECIAGQPDDVEGVHHRHRLGELLGSGGYETGEPVHGDDLDSGAPDVVAELVKLFV